eukprot:COSAG01_NODE_4955_length_4591_cov_6.138468_4_plen_62_part_00
MYHNGLKQWIEVAGHYDLNERRRLAATHEGRRQLGAASAGGMFAFIDDAEDTFKCEVQAVG